jgi:hypothetical protein
MKGRREGRRGEGKEGKGRKGKEGKGREGGGGRRTHDLGNRSTPMGKGGGEGREGRGGRHPYFFFIIPSLTGKLQGRVF